MTPIIKKKGLDTEELAHFRPLCQGAVMNKIIDKQIHNQMSEYLQENEMESPNQAGYREHNSTETLLIAMHSKLLNDYANNKIQILITLDFSAAFDCLRINQIKEKLKEEFGFEDKAHELLCDYFTDRFYTIEIGGHKSKKTVP